MGANEQEGTESDHQTDSKKNSREWGEQPVNFILAEFGLENNVLVEASTEQLTHKQIQKARKGRQVTPNIQRKVKRALEKAIAARGTFREFALGELFNYDVPVE